MKTKTTLLLFAIILQSLIATAQNEWQCLSSGVYAKAIAEDDNYLWIGNLTGLVRINKATQERSFYNKTNSPIPDETVNDIVIEPSGAVWIATGSWLLENSGGLARFDGMNWQVFSTENSELPVNYVTSLALDNSGVLWMGTYEGGAVSFNGTDWQIFNADNSAIPNDKVNDLTFDDNAVLWMATDGGLVKVEGDVWTVFGSQTYGLYALTSISVTANGHIWMGSWNGIFHYNGSFFTNYNVSNSPIPQNYVETIYADDAGLVWMGCNMEGLCTYDGTTWTIYTEENSELPNDIVNVIFPRPSGKILIGNGGSLAEFDGLNWSLINASATPLPGLQVFDIVGDKSNNDKWIAAGEGVARFDGTNWKVYDKSNSPINSNLRAIGIYSSDNVYMASATQGLIGRYQNQWTVYDPSNSGLPEAKLTCLNIDPMNGMWIGTETKGLALWSSTGHWYTFNISNSDLPNNNINAVISDNEGNVFIATDGGVAKYNYYYGWKVYNESNGLLDNTVSDIVLDNNNVLWIAMDGGGLAKLDGEQLTSWGYDSGLPTMYLTSIATDNKGNIFIGTWNDGIVQFNGTEFINYNSFNSRLNYDYINTLFVDNHSNLWIGSKRCITLYNKDGVLLNNRNGLVSSLEPSIQCYPNPAKDQFRVNLPEGTTMLGYEITSLTGQCIRSYTETAQNTQTTHNVQIIQNIQSLIPINSLHPGIYLLKAHTNTGIRVLKFIKN